MTIIACPECQNGVSHTAISCPKCGYQIQGQQTSQPPQKTAKKSSCLLLIVLVFVLSLSVCVVGFVAKSTSDFKKEAKAKQIRTKTHTKTKSVKAKVVKKVLKVSAEEIWQDYQDNEVSAEEKYAGKPFIVTGNIKSIKTDFIGSIIVHLRVRNKFLSVHSTIVASEKSKAAKLKKGDLLSLQCIGNGAMIGKPFIRACTILE